MRPAENVEENADNSGHFEYEDTLRRISALGWSTDLRQLPELNFIQLYDYLVVSTRKYRHIVLKGTNYKKLKSYQFFFEGNVKRLECKVYQGKTCVKASFRRLLTNVKDKDKPEDRQGAVYKIKCCDCQASYIGETGRNLSTRLTEHKRATRNGDVNNHIAEHHLQTKHQIDWDSATCITYSTDYHQRLTLESWFTNLEQTPLNRSQQLPAPYKRLIDGMKRN